MGTVRRRGRGVFRPNSIWKFRLSIPYQGCFVEALAGQVKHLASHVLGQMARRLASDWERIYGHPIYFLETFVDPERHRGTCYRAANWVVMGRTTGRGKNCPNKRPNRSLKEVLGYPLTPRFRELLAEG